MLDREQLARVVHDAIMSLDDVVDFGEHVTNCLPWITLDRKQVDWYTRIGEAVAEAIHANQKDRIRGLVSKIFPDKLEINPPPASSPDRSDPEGESS